VENAVQQSAQTVMMVVVVAMAMAVIPMVDVIMPAAVRPIVTTVAHHVGTPIDRRRVNIDAGVAMGVPVTAVASFRIRRKCCQGDQPDRGEDQFGAHVRLRRGNAPTIQSSFTLMTKTAFAPRRSARRATRHRMKCGPRDAACGPGW
jgi:hypothetical protein